MRPEARARAEAMLRGARLDAAYLCRRLSTSERTRALAHGLEARGRAIDHYFDQEADLAVRVARLAGELSAFREQAGLHAERLEDAYGRLGGLRAERARLDARLQAELQAMITTKRLLKIRLSVR